MINLYGKLAKDFEKAYNQKSKKLNIKVSSIAEAIKALEANFPNFRNLIQRDRQYRVVRGDSLKTGKAIAEEELAMQFSEKEWHIIPIPVGYGGNNAGILTTVLGLALVATTFIINPAAGTFAASMFGAAGFGGFVGSLGLALTFGGLAQMLSPNPSTFDYSQREVEKRPSYIFNGAVNSVQPGLTIPVVYGESWIGSIFISGGLKIEDITV